MTENPNRPIRSFVKRQGRITPGQKAALREQYHRYGVEIQGNVIDLIALFAKEAPIALEIGCGNGDAMIEMATLHPDINFIGVEVYEPGVGRLLANIDQHKLTNVRVVMGDAVELLRRNIPDQSLSKVMIYFPDPWHKKRHNKRRLINPEFVALLCEKLTAGGELHLATDWESYAEQMQAVCDACTTLQGGLVARPELRPLTKFEQRGQRLGHGTWDFIYRLSR